MSRRTRWSRSIPFCAAGLALSAATANAAVVVPDGGFVVHGSTAEIKQGIDVAHAAGARWVSLATSWEALEPQPDSYLTPGGAGTAAWDGLAERLAYAEAKGMSVELRFANAPQWASGRAGSDDPPTPANVPAYGQLLADVAQRFGPQIDAYSPWNEPNITVFWNPVDPEAYTALQKVAYTAIKAVDPSATVLSAAIVGRYNSQNSGYSFLRRAYQAGLKGHADVIGWNGYPGGEPESDGPVEGGLPAANTLPAQLYLRTLIDEFDPGRRVWIMEMGWSTCVSCNASPANAATEAQQADYLTRAFTYRRRYLTGITDRIFWYQLRDSGTNRSDWYQNQGVVRADSSPKPALAAFGALGTEEPEPGAPGGGTPGTGAPATAANVLPPAAARLPLPTRAASPTGRTILGKPRLTARKGVFTLTFRVAVRGGRTTLRIEGYRLRKWRPIKTVRIPRSGKLTLRFRDKAYVGLRVRGTVPGRKGFRVGRVVRIPAKLLRPASVAPTRPLPASAARLRLPVRASSAGGATVIGTARVGVGRGALRLSLPVKVSGGRTVVRVDAFRDGRWRVARTIRLSRSTRVSLRVRDRDEAALRVRGTVPGRTGFRVGRVVKIPAKLLRVG